MNLIRQYIDETARKIRAVDEDLLAAFCEAVRETSGRGGKVVVAGNGGSAAIASHVAVDFSKNAGIRAINFNEAALITCLANDCGYESWLAEAIGMYADPEDLVVLISSSGKSPNILNAAARAREMGMRVVTFSGFSSDNPLRKAGDLNFWVDSRGYNVVELAHHAWLLAAVDALIGSSEYVARPSAKRREPR